MQFAAKRKIRRHDMAYGDVGGAGNLESNPKNWITVEY